MIGAIVTDIEGTTSSLSFVKDVLFPYARNHLADYVHAHATEPAVAEQLETVRRTLGGTPSLQQVIDQLLQWVDEDRKETPLKALQGMVWEAGYRNGSFKGHVYEDAVHRLLDWHGAGLRLYVYSSGSVQAQKLLFAHTEFGDLTHLFSGYFDTNVGGKRDSASYSAIADAIDLAPEAILFLSDIVAELDAARSAGMQTVQLVRDGDPAGDDAGHPQVRDFSEIYF